MRAKQRTTGRNHLKLDVPAAHDWRTTDEQEINRRKLRAREESFRISNLDQRHPIFSNFRVESASGMIYQVEIRNLMNRRFSCSCVDFRASGLGTCKHVEGVLLYLQRRHRKLYKEAAKGGSNRLSIELDRENGTLRLCGDRHQAPRAVRTCFNSTGTLRERSNGDPAALLERWRRRCGDLWISQEIDPWLAARRDMEEAVLLRRDYEMKVRSGEWPLQETLVPLFPYQREGMLHLAFKERALLADEMGLGKTIQAIAACALLHRLGRAQRALVVTPASLKSEWEEQIRRFTTLPLQVVFGSRRNRLQLYASPTFFTIVNYEQMRADALDVNQRMGPDIVILDEAQRIKNWDTKTAQATKRLQSRYAFVLTGTPIENRIDELHSLMDFLNPEVLGPLFRFNRDFYQMDDRGRPMAYRNLEQLHQRISPYMLRRRKSEVESELPGRTDHNRFIEMSKGQWENYLDHEKVARKLLALARKRPLRKVELDILQRELATMRMICDTNYIVDLKDSTCPKLAELERILEDAMSNDAKVIVFSEWERMLQLVRRLCEKLGLGFAWHTGKVPQNKRRKEINMFKTDPECRVFLSTDSGSTGLNLQNASIVVNCDLPWNPAKLEQRIARAWRKNQTQAVTVFNLVAEKTIEHGMLDTLASKQSLSDGVLDRMGELNKIPLRGGRQAFLERLQQMVAVTSVPKEMVPPTNGRPSDLPQVFAEKVHAHLGDALLQCEERFPANEDYTVVLVTVNDKSRNVSHVESIYKELFAADPDASVRLEIIDQATAEALARLEAAGLYEPTFRSSRPLHPQSLSAPPTSRSLTSEQKARIHDCRGKAERDLKMAEVLGSGGFVDETREPLSRALHQLGIALAIQHELPKPKDSTECLRAPHAGYWNGDATVLHRWIRDDNADWKAVMRMLQNHADNLSQIGAG